MRKMYLLFLALILTACGAASTQPPQPTPVPPTAQVIVATVLVPVEVTSAATSMPLPTNTSAPTPTDVPPTLTPTQEVPPTQSTETTNGLIALDPKFNGQSFERISISTDKFSLNCQPKEISFDVYSTDKYIVKTDLYFRMRDKHSNDIPPWTVVGTMETDGLNHFWMTLRGDQIKADLRKYQGLFDFQFVGLNQVGDAVGRSEKITDVVSYTINCQ